MNDAKAKLDDIIGSRPGCWLTPPHIFLIIAIVCCCAIALGWALHYGRYKGDADQLALTNRTLSGRVEALDSELETLREKTTEVVAQLTQANQWLAETNETLADDLSTVSKSLETVAAQNKTVIEEITRLNRENAATTAESTKNISELTTVIISLTDDLNKANLRLNDLINKLQAKTEEAAELSIKVNTLVEMVARLRVLTGLTAVDIEEARRQSTAAADANSLPETPAPATSPLP